MPPFRRLLQSKPRVLAVLVAAVMIISASIVGVVVIDNWLKQPYHHDGGYVIENPVVDEAFTQKPSSVIVTPAADDVLILFTKAGMTFYGNGTSDNVRITRDGAADTVAISFNMKSVLRYDNGSALVRTTFDLGNGDSVSAAVEPSIDDVQVTFASLIGGRSDVQLADYFHDHTDRMDVLFQVKNGSFLVEVNGVESTYQMPLLDTFQPRLGSVDMSERTNVPLMSPVTVANLQIGYGTRAYYKDGLHKTILPDGKDFTFVMHMHADRAYPAQMWEMANLSREYGLVGSYDAWWNGSTLQYGMESPQYVAALHALQDAGWGIGVHAGGYSSMTREQVIAALENITTEFGPIAEWSDHGTVKQDLSQQGTNQSSPYYTEDLIEAIGAAWWNNGSHSNSPYYDLNIDGMSYEAPGHEDVPSFRVSEGYGRDLFSYQGRQANLSSYLRAWAYDRSVFVMHDYFAFYFYANTTDGNFSVNDGQNGIGNYPWSQLNPKKVFVDDQWLPMPQFQSLLDMTKDYNVWFATVREVYERSAVVQKIIVEETDDEVRITNPTSEGLTGFTLFTRSMPDFELAGPSAIYQAQKGTVDSWSFVIDLAPGEVLVLHKVHAGAHRAANMTSESGTLTMIGELILREKDL